MSQSFLSDYMGMERNLPSNPKPRPFMKWMGGKQSMMELLKPYIIKGEHYYEPFIGGGSVFFWMYNNKLLPDMETGAKIVLGDLNGRLINLYTIIRDKPYDFLDELGTYMNRNNKDYFYSVRDRKYDDNVKDAALFLYLNKTCYKGIYEEDKDGKWSPGFAYRDRIKVFEHTKLLNASASLQGVDIRNERFQVVMEEAPVGSFIYLDPPYYKTFESYTKERFTPFVHRELKNLSEKLWGAGVYLMQSNSNHPDLHRLYKKWSIKVIKFKYKVNYKTKEETIIYNYDPTTKTLKTMKTKGVWVSPKKF